MALTVTCPSCHRQGNLPDSFPGGKIKCSACGVVTDVPAPKRSQPQAQAQGPARPSTTAPRPQSRPAPASPPPSRPPAARPAAPVARPQPASRFLDGADEDGDEVGIPVAPRHAPTRSLKSAEGSKATLPIILGVGGGVALLLALIVGLTTLNRPAGNEMPGPVGGPAPPPQYAFNPNDPPQPDGVEATSTGPGGNVTLITPPANSYPQSASPPPPPSSSGPSESPEQTIKRVKDATVYIKVRTAKGRGAGSGFVIRTEGDSVLIATNRHVISHEERDESEDEGSDSGQPAKKAAKAAPTLTVVFRSGEGPGQEQELPAQVLAADRTGDLSRDLAILTVKGVSRPPRPIELNRTTQPTEGMPLRTFGFPFGEMLDVASSRDRNPAITVGRGSVSSLRRDDLGHLSVIQIDGSLQPGNSGGPIVDERGLLVGVAVAKLRIADSFGLVIPTAHLDEVLNGRVGKLTVELVSDASTSLELQAHAELTDPMGKLRSVSILVAPQAPEPPKPAGRPANSPSIAGMPGAPGTPGGQASAPAPARAEATGPKPMPPDARNVPLIIDRATRTASARFSLPVTGALASGSRQVLVQIHFTSGDGRTFRSVPKAYAIPSQPGKLAAVGELDPDLEKKARNTLRKLGPLVDPDKDCKMVRSDKTIKISIPAKLHTLAPQIVDRRNRPFKNAPMTLATVTGDFLVHVRVTSPMHPGAEPLRDPKTGRPLPITFQGAGIVLWQDKNNFIRLERCSGTAGGPTLVTRVLVEVYQNGVGVGRPYYINVPEGPMSVMMLRIDGRIRCLFSNDGQRWTMLQEIAAEYPGKLQVGLHAVNMSKKPFTAEFENFALIEDKDVIGKFKTQ